jgi:succinate dehydrogenase / fumarate reductase cytochrome b subunit
MATAVPVSPETTKTQGKLRDPYFWHKLHSLSGIVPIGIFLLQHLIANSYALRGAAAYNTVIAVFGYLPFVAVLEIVIIYIPILYHSFYGIYITAHGQANLGRYSYGRNWMYFLQRVSGVIAFFYIGFHIWNTSIQKYIMEWRHLPNPEGAISYQMMSAQMANPWFFAAYFIGITATVFHFTNGLWNFCIRWGLTISARSQRLNAYFCWGLFALFTLIGLATLISLHNAGVNGVPTSAVALAH